MNTYYAQHLLLPQVNKNDKIIGPVERWKAHKEGILHRAFTVALFYKGRILCQHRKHPVFDGFLDLTLSSHWAYKNARELEDQDAAVYTTLYREWGVEKKNLSKLKNPGKIYYKAASGDFTEHEIDYLIAVESEILPKLNLEYSYGYSLLTPEELKSTNKPIAKILAPWVQEILTQNLL